MASDRHDAARLLRSARQRAGLSQRALAERGGTSQSVVARIETGDTRPTMATLTRLLGAAGFDLATELEPRYELDPQLLEDVERILRLSPEDRLREVGNLARFLVEARRA